jgi:hypothetical protein
MTREEYETRSAVLNFLGNIYREVTQVDSNIVGAKSHLQPKREEFTKLAERAVEDISRNPDLFAQHTTVAEQSYAKEQMSSSVGFPKELVSAVIGIDNTLKGIYDMLSQQYGNVSKNNLAEQK